ncbi:MAG: chaperone modulator CbpM [Parvibaculum sp.]
MTGIDDLLGRIEALQRHDLEAWIGEELVAPREEAGALVFSEMECARVRLICTLRYDLEIEAGALPVILSLIDQLYDTRQQLMALTAAVAKQDEAVREAVVRAMRE